jgi:acyl-CoA thioesterase
MDGRFGVVDKDAFAKLAGIQIVEAGPGRAVARMAIRPEHLNGLGLVHGGAVFTLADVAFAAACNPPGQPTVAINVSISFLKAATAGTLTATCTEDSFGGRIGAYTAHVTDESGQIVAVFHGLAYRRSTGAAATGG